MIFLLVYSQEPLIKTDLEETLNTPRISLRKDDSFQNVCTYTSCQFF